MCGSFQRFHLRLGLFPFYELGCVLQKCVGLRAAEEESRHLELGEIAPDVEVVQTCQVDVRFPFWRIEELKASVFRGTGHSFDIDAQIFITHVAKYIPLAISAKNDIEIVKGASAFLRARDLRMHFVSQPHRSDDFPKDEAAGHKSTGSIKIKAWNLLGSRKAARNVTIAPMECPTPMTGLVL